MDPVIERTALEESAPTASQASAAAEWNCSSGIKLFYLGSGNPGPITGIGFIPMPSASPIPGYVCQAARALLNVSQAWLWQRAKVSRKTINDFENGLGSPKAALNLRLRRALEEAGAQFVFGKDVVGVVVHATRNDAAQRSRSEKHRAPR
ncbi:DNA-binding XRE family transcriptional regulator [Bosea sp. OAE752]|uniref:hypothetical protein n=1 Tax=Bosea sp. OAE752 TaxID=2663873 RepID=UPI003D254A57